MKPSLFLSSVVVAASLASAAHANPIFFQRPIQPEPERLLLRVRSGDAEEAARLLAGMGKVEGRLRGDRRFRVLLVPGVSADTAIARLALRPEVASVEKTVAISPLMAAAYSLSAAGQIEELIEKRGSTRNLEGRKRQEMEKLDRWKAREYYLQQRAYPNETVDFLAIDRARQQRDRMPSTAFGASAEGERATMAVSPVRWEFIGPRNMDVSHNWGLGQPPISGRVNAVTYNANGSAIYAGGPGGGVWKSTDNGATWQWLSSKWSSLEVGSMAAHPTNGNILFVGTGDHDGWSGNVSLGVMKTIDGGASWKQLGAANGFTDYAVSDVLVSPDNGNTVIVALGRGRLMNGNLWRSTNGGDTWTMAVGVGAAWCDLSAGVKGPSGEPRYMYASAAGNLLYRSGDQGFTWTQVTGPYGAAASSTWPMRVVASCVDRNTVYVLDTFNEKIYKSTNAGASWTDITGNINTTGQDWGQGWYDSYIGVTKNGTTEHLFVGLIDLSQSVGANGTWRTVAYAYSNTNTNLIHVDQHCMAVHPTNPNQALMGSDGGLYRYNYTPSNDTWTFTSIGGGLGITEFYAFDVHPTNPDVVLGGTQDNATPYSGGNLNAWDNVVSGDGSYCAINPVNPLNQYGSWQFLSVHRTDNGWGSRYGIGPSYSGNALFIAPIELDRNNPNNLYAGSEFLYRYNATANTWSAPLAGLDFTPGSSASISEITVSPGDSNRIYVGTSNGLVWMTTNGGTSWTQINTGTVSLPNRFIRSISVNPANNSDVLVTVSGTGTGHVWRCTDTLSGARTWSNVSGNLPDAPANDIARDPDDPATSWHVATDVGVFSTFNGGASWSNSTAPLGLPNAICNMITVRGRTLLVATFGRGIWRLELPTRNAVTGLTLDKTSLDPGQTVTGTVTLAAPAGASGDIVSLASSHESVVVPATITIPAGQTTGTFTGTCVNAQSSTPSTVVTLSAGRPGSAVSANITTRMNMGGFVNQTVPTRMFAGESYPTWQNWKNTGGTTWTNAKGYKLQSRNPTNNTNWGTNRILLPTTSNVVPGNTPTLFAQVTAPASPGTYNWQWSPIHEGVGSFEFWGPNTAISVIANPGNNATFVTQSVPTTIEAGNDFNATITMQNNGTTTWTNAGKYWLHSQEMTDNYYWGPNRVTMGASDSVAPGSQYTFTRTFTAPITTGNKIFRWRMSWDNVDFGAITPRVVINVTAAADNAQFISMSGVPTSIPRNSTFTVSMTFKNLGSNTWTSAGGYGVASQWPTGNTTWGVGFVGVPSSVAPNANVTFTQTFTAPATPGTYLFQFRMRNTAKPGFGQFTTGVNVTVT